jgi:hypothetical protein
MSIALFHLARNLKFTRFAIDVLLQRLEQLKPRCAEQNERILLETKQSVQNCDHLHNDLCERFCAKRSFDTGSVASLLSTLEELNRRIADSIAKCNVFEFGTLLRSA